MIVIYAAPWRAEIKYLDFSVSFQIVTCLLAWILAAKIFIFLLWPFSWLLFLFFRGSPGSGQTSLWGWVCRGPLEARVRNPGWLAKHTCDLCVWGGLSSSGYHGEGWAALLVACLDFPLWVAVGRRE